jgi:ABC-type branched-subunit amino acid transport system substrate-binding protein
VRRAAVPTVAVLLLTGLAGCGAGSAGTNPRHFSSLCIDVGLPLSGHQAGAGQAFLAGLRRVIPATGLSLGGYRIGLCHIDDDAVGGVVNHATAAAEDVQTIAYVGELSAGDATLAEAVLAPAGIALVTPSGPAPAPNAGTLDGAGVGALDGAAPRAAPMRSTALYLLPSARTQADAMAHVRATAAGCTHRLPGQPTCTLIDAASAPLCTGIAPSDGEVARLCVLAGPDFYAWPSPAVAYGDSAAQLLVSTLRTVARRGGDVADRATLLSALSRTNLTTSPLGVIRFDAKGGMEADLFTAYTVKRDGGLAKSVSELFRTH